MRELCPVAAGRKLVVREELCGDQARPHSRLGVILTFHGWGSPSCIARKAEHKPDQTSGLPDPLKPDCVEGTFDVPVRVLPAQLAAGPGITVCSQGPSPVPGVPPLPREPSAA